MLVPALTLLGLILAAGLVALGVAYRRYAHSPATAWKRKVHAAVAEQETRLRTARRQLVRSDGDDARRLREEYLILQLRGLGVEELAKYPGIGPVTVARLREAGLATVADCARARLSAVPGVGPSRQADLKDALKKIRREAESRFDAGASREAVAYAQELKRRDAERAGRRQAAEQAVREAERALDYLREADRVARRITFLGHLFGHRPAGLTDELVRRPLTPPAPQPEEKVTPVPPTTANIIPEPTPVSPSPPVSGGEGLGVRGVEPPAVENQRPAAASANPPHPRPLSPRSGGSRMRGGETVAPTATRPPVGSAPGLPSPPPLPPPVPPVVVPPPPAPTPLDRLRVVAGFGLAVAKADGRIAQAERRQIRAFLERRYAPGIELVNWLDAVLVDVENDLPTLGDALWDVRRVIPQADWPDLYQFAQSVADASGERNTREVECLARIAEELGVGLASRGREPPVLERALPPGAYAPGSPGPLPRSPDEPPSELDCRAALEIAPESPLSVDLIRRQYHLLTERFAPEKFAAHGPEFVQMAAEKRARAERAARHLLAEYNEPLEPPEAAPPPADPRHNPDLDAVFGV